MTTSSESTAVPGASRNALDGYGRIELPDFQSCLLGLSAACCEFVEAPMAARVIEIRVVCSATAIKVRNIGAGESGSSSEMTYFISREATAACADHRLHYSQQICLKGWRVGNTLVNWRCN